MKNFGESETAVSTVIGVVLMVGLTVVMISAVAFSVLAFALPENAPQAKIVIVEAKGDIGTTALYINSIVLKHKGGEALLDNNTRIIITGKGYAYTGEDSSLKDIRVTYAGLSGENYIPLEGYGYFREIVDGTSWDAGETITLYGSDGVDPFGIHHNTVDNKWKLQAGSTVSVTIIDTTTNQVIAVSQATVKDV